MPASRLSDSVVATCSYLRVPGPLDVGHESSSLGRGAADRRPRAAVRCDGQPRSRVGHGHGAPAHDLPTGARRDTDPRPAPGPSGPRPADPLPWYPVSDAADTQLTRDTYERLQAELEDLTTRGRVEIAALIEAARALGDLKENGDYHAAKDTQGKMESRIRQLEQMLKNGHHRRRRAAVGRHRGPRLGRDPALRGRRRGRHHRLLRRLHRGAPGRPDRGVPRARRWARPCSATPWATPSSTRRPGAASGSRS